MPKQFGKYIEPFLGGGALFFALQPVKSVISDANPELILFYEEIAVDVDKVLKAFQRHKNTEDWFYEVRALDWQDMPRHEAAARMLFLNRTCFNGLYRVNKNGQFNVPFGKYKNPLNIDVENLRRAASLLSKSRIICADYVHVLQEHAHADDFIFLDPPYVPVSAYADFKRYTKDQFREEDHEELASVVRSLELKKMPCSFDQFQP